jgi:hypothetical protein
MLKVFFLGITSHRMLQVLKETLNNTEAHSSKPKPYNLVIITFFFFCKELVNYEAPNVSRPQTETAAAASASVRGKLGAVRLVHAISTIQRSRKAVP